MKCKNPDCKRTDFHTYLECDDGRQKPVVNSPVKVISQVSQVISQVSQKHCPTCTCKPPTKQQRWRQRNIEKHRLNHREYMRAYRGNGNG